MAGFYVFTGKQELIIQHLKDIVEKEKKEKDIIQKKDEDKDPHFLCLSSSNSESGYKFAVKYYLDVNVFVASAVATRLLPEVILKDLEKKLGIRIIDATPPNVRQSSYINHIQEKQAVEYINEEIKKFIAEQKQKAIEAEKAGSKWFNFKFSNLKPAIPASKITENTEENIVKSRFKKNI